MKARESLYTADSCADYLEKFYPLPHTYKNSVIARIIIPILIIITINVVQLGYVLSLVYSARHHPNPGQHTGIHIAIFCAFCVFCSFWFLSMFWQKTVIDDRSITVTLAVSKTTIAANDVLGYAIDVIAQSRGVPSFRFSIIRQVKGRQNEKIRISINKNDLNDPKLRGLFESMKNYGDVKLGDILDDVEDEQYPRAEALFLALVVVVTLVALWLFIPLIQLNLEQLHALSRGMN